MQSTTKRILALIMALALLTLAACSDEAAPSSSTPEPDPPLQVESAPPASTSSKSESSSELITIDQQTPENNEYGVKFFVVPEMTAEQQAFCTDYVEKLLYSGMLLYEWNSDNYSSISKEAGGASHGSDLMLAFEDIIGQDEMQKLFQQYDGNFPAETVEDVLLKYFPFTAKELHEVLSYHYNAETNTYQYDGGRGGGPIAAAVVNVRPEINGPLRLDYEVYSGYSGLDYTPDSYMYKTPGVLVLAPDLNGGYRYLFVEDVGETVEAPPVSALSSPDEAENYQGLTKEEWDGLQKQKAEYEALSDANKQMYLMKYEIGCSKFIHMGWEHYIDNTLIQYVGSDQFDSWITEQQANDQCIDIYSFADYFMIDLETLTSLIRDNNLGELYPIEKLEARYAFMIKR